MRIKTVPAFALLICAAFVSGCTSTPSQIGSPSNETSQSSSSNTTTTTNYLTVTNFVTVTVTNYTTEPAPKEDLQTRDGLSLRDAQDKALKLEPGLAQDEVLLLLGKPDETSAETYGAQTPKPWNGMAWYYRWGNQPSFRSGGLSDNPDNVPAVNNHKILTIIFNQDSGAVWVVNSWQWSDF